MTTLGRIFIIVLGLAGSAVAQVPDTLKYPILAPLKPQADEWFGASVAADGNRIVVGAPHDNSLDYRAGVAKVFDAVTGELLHVLPHPRPGPRDEFGCSVGISGTWVVVGAHRDDGGNTGRVFVFDLSRAVPSHPAMTFNNPSPEEDDDFGYSVAISGTRIVVGTPRDATGAQDAGSVYVYDTASATPTAPVLILNNPEPTVFANFGRSVAISGTRVVVGSNADKVYAYDLLSSTPNLPARTIVSPGGQNFNFFGGAVAISGIWVVVGASGDDTGAPDAGIAYVYNLASPNPSVPAFIMRNPSPMYADQFGCSVAIAGSRIVIGAKQGDVGGTNAGNAYVYNIAGATPNVPGTILVNPTPVAFDSFGYSVAIAGTRVVVGAPEDNTDATDIGSAYVYDISNPTTVLTATLHHPGTPWGIDFGQSVALSGSLAVIGAPSDDAPEPSSGRAHVFDLARPAAAEPILTLVNPTPDPGDSFGTSVAIDGTRIVVGAPWDSVSNWNAGSAYMYDVTSATPTVPVATLNNPDPGSYSQFGSAVAISGSLVVIGAPYRNTSFLPPGSVYVYNVAGASPNVPIVTLTNPDSANGSFGSSVAISGQHVVVGSRGGAHVYNLGNANPAVPVLSLINPNPGANLYFTFDVAISGTRVVVGNPYDPDGIDNVYVYDLASTTPAQPILTIDSPSPVPYSSFGMSVAISGTRVMAGTPFDDAAGTSAGGSIHVFDLASATPGVPVAKVEDPTGSYGARFGFALAFDGDFAVVGAPWTGQIQGTTGRAYVIGPPGPGGPGPGGSGGADADHDGLPDSWEHLYFGTTVGHSALDDADGDGVCELLEMAFDRHPLWPEKLPVPEAVIEGGYLTTTIAKRPGVGYLVQSGAALDGAAFSAATTTVLINNNSTLKVRDNIQVSTPGSRFMRVKVASPQ